METMLLGLNMILLYVLWRFIWRKTALDRYRDVLFDLRDESKRFFIEHNYGLSHPLYIELRALLNGHIRYTEKLTMSVFISETVAMSAHPEVARELINKVNSRFATEDKILADHISNIRTRAIVTLAGHMGESSFSFLVTYPFVYIMIAVVKAVNYARQNNAKITSSLRCALKFAPVAGLMIAIPARAGIITPEFDVNIVEEYSYQAAQH